MISSRQINSAAWTAITTAGQSGTCWIKKEPSKGKVVIHHGENGAAPLNIEDGFVMWSSSVNLSQQHAFITLTADTPDDVFYARCSATDETATINLDLF